MQSILLLLLLLLLLLPLFPPLFPHPLLLCLLLFLKPAKAGISLQSFSWLLKALAELLLQAHRLLVHITLQSV